MSNLEWRDDTGIVLSGRLEAIVSIDRDSYLTISVDDPQEASKVPAALAALPEVRAELATAERLPELRGIFERILCVARSSGGQTIGNIELADRLMDAVAKWREGQQP